MVRQHFQSCCQITVAHNRRNISNLWTLLYFGEALQTWKKGWHLIWRLLVFCRIIIANVPSPSINVGISTTSRGQHCSVAQMSRKVNESDCTLPQSEYNFYLSIYLMQNSIFMWGTSSPLSHYFFNLSYRFGIISRNCNRPLCISAFSAWYDIEWFQTQNSLARVPWHTWNFMSFDTFAGSQQQFCWTAHLEAVQNAPHYRK